MPRATLPTTLPGWIVAVATGAVGFIAGFVFLYLLEHLGIA